MSFIQGIEKEITHFFSGASDTFSGVVNFGTNIINGVQNAVQGVIHGIANIAQGIYNGLASIGSEIATVFGQLGGAIWHGIISFATSFGTFFYEAFHTVASAIYGAFQRIANGFEYIGKWMWSGIVHIGDALASFGEWLYSGIREVGVALTSLTQVFASIYADIKQFFITIWNGLVAIGKDIVNFFESVAKGIEGLFNDLTSFVTNLANDMLYIPEEASKYVVSRVSQVLPRLVSYNLFFEELKSLDRVAENMASRGSIPTILMKMWSPVLAGITSLIAGSALQTIFPEITSIAPMSRKTLTPPPTSNVSKTLQIPNVFQQQMSPYSVPTISVPSRATVTTPSPTTFEKYIVGVREDDEEILSAEPYVTNQIASPYPNTATVVDQFAVNGYIVQTTRQFVSFSASQGLYVLPYAQLKVTTIKESDSVDVGFTGGTSLINYLLGIPICSKPSNNAPVSSISGAINEGISDVVAICQEVDNVNSDSGYSGFVPTNSMQLLPPPYVPLSQSETSSVGFVPTSSMQSLPSPYVAIAVSETVSVGVVPTNSMQLLPPPYTLASQSENVSISASQY